MEKKHKEMGELPIGKLLLKFSIPAIIGMLVNALYNVVDRIYLGRIANDGPNALAGVGLVFPIMLLSFSICLLIGMGGATNISLFLGKKKKDVAEQFLGVATLLSFISGTLSAILTIWGMDLYIVKLGTSVITEPFAKDYLKIIALGFPFVSIGFVTNSAVRSDGNPKVSMITLLLGAITNIILDPIFIFKFDMGVRGAALATIISQIVSAVWTVGYFMSKYSGIKLRFKYLTLNLQKIKQIIFTGSGPFTLQLGVSAANMVLNRSLSRIGGDISIKAMSIIFSITTFIYMPTFGINQGMIPIVGYNYGAKLYKRVKETFRYAICGAMGISTVGFLLIQIFARFFIRGFVSDEAVIEATTVGIRFFTILYPVVGFQIVSTSYFQGIGKPKITMFLSLSRQVLFLIPLVLIFGNKLGVTGIWLATPTADMIATILTFFIVRKEMIDLNRLEKLEQEK